MIRKVNYSNIDFEKYDSCIENSVQKNFYARREILDFLCEAWELLVFGDYIAVMPIPIKKNLGFRFVISPIFCQQLGVFSIKNDRPLNQMFFEYFNNKYRILYYPFSSGNLFETPIFKKKNYIILQQDYDLLKKKFSKGRKAILTKSGNYVDFKKLIYDEEVERYIQQHFKGLDKPSDIKSFMDFTKFLAKNDQLSLQACYDKDKLLSMAIIATWDSTMVLLALINDKSLIKYNGATLLVNNILQENIALKNFDFMGGNLRGIEIFFKSFGAELEEYAIIENSKLSLLKNLPKF